MTGMSANGIPFSADRHFVISFSGGKDSTATWLHLVHDLGLKNVTCVFADTGHESELTYEYLRFLERCGMPLVRVQARVREMWKGDVPAHIPADWHDLPLTMERLSAIKGRFPSTVVKFCTQFLKVYPLQKYLRTLDNPVSVHGVRADESQARKDLPETAFDLDVPCDVWRPLIQWTAEDVFACHKRHGIEPNPLYKMGCSRVGCFPCIHVNKGEVKAIAERFPQRFTELREMELRVGAMAPRGQASFFSPNRVGAAYRSQLDPVSLVRYPTALDVERWGLGLGPNGEKQDDIFEEPDTEPPSCSSVYGLCE